MKYKILFILLSSLISCQLSAAKCPGFIVRNADTMAVTFKVPLDLFGHPSFSRIQYKIKYIDSTGTHTLFPGNAGAIQFTNNGITYRMLSKPNVFHKPTPAFLHAGHKKSDTKYLFLRLIIEGRMSMYSYYYFNGRGGSKSNNMGTQEKNYIARKNEDFHSFDFMGFKDTMIEYLGDCPALQKRVENKTYGYSNLEDIVQYYNEHCGE